MAPTGPKCDKQEVLVLRSCPPKMRVGTYVSKNDGGRLIAASTDEINAGSERRICYRSQEFMCLLGGLLEIWLCLSPPPFLLRCRMAECLQCAHPNFFCTHTYILTHRFTIPLKYLNANYL